MLPAACPTKFWASENLPPMSAPPTAAAVAAAPNAPTLSDSEPSSLVVVSTGVPPGTSQLFPNAIGLGWRLIMPVVT